MAIKVKKAEPIGDLVVRNAPQYNLTMGQAPQRNVVMGQAPQPQRVVMGQPQAAPTIRVSGAAPVMGQPRMRPMDNPLAWLGNTAKSFVSGVAETLNPIEAFPGLARGIANTLAYNSEDAKNARAAQEALQLQNIELMQRAAAKINDPMTSPQERARWQAFVVNESRQQRPQYLDATMANDDIIAATNPAEGAMNLAGVVGTAADLKGVATAGREIMGAIANSQSKRAALDYLVKTGDTGWKNIPVKTVDGGSTPIPVATNPKSLIPGGPTGTKIPVRSVASNDVLDARLSKEVDIQTKRYEAELKVAELSDSPLLAKEAVETKYSAIFDDLMKQRETDTIPQRIDVKDAPKSPKTSKKADKQKAKVALKKEEQQDYTLETTSNTGKPSVTDRIIRTTNGVLNKMGTGGKAVARGARRARDFSEKTTARDMKEIRNAGFDDVDSSDFVKIVDAIESGKIGSLSSEHQNVAKTMVKVLKGVRDRGVAAGGDIGDFGETYFPRWYKDANTGRTNFTRKEFNQKFGNLEKKRVDGEDGYEKTHEAFVRYIERANERVGRIQEFGQKDEKLAAMFDAAKKEGQDMNMFDRYAKTALGDVEHDETIQKISGGVRQVMAATHLQRTAMANLGQSMNTMSVTGIKNSAKAVLDYFDPEKLDWAENTGVFSDHVLGSNMSLYTGAERSVSKSKALRAVKDFVMSPMMKQVEKYNRAHAALSFRRWVEDDLLPKAANGNKNAIRILKKNFDYDYKPGVAPSTEDIIDMARKGVEVTQFKVDDMDLPRTMTGPVAKIITQFRSFGYKQTEFVARQVIGEALKGNFAPLARFTTVAIPMGYTLNTAKEMGTDLISDGINAVIGTDKQEEEKKEDQSLTSKLLSAYGTGFMQIGGGGLVTSEIQNAQSNWRFTKGESKDKLIGVAVGALGPFAGTIMQGLTAAGSAVDGDPKKALEFGARKLPIVGPYVGRAIKDATRGNTTDPSTMDKKEFDKYESKTYAEFAGNLKERGKDILSAVNDKTYAEMGIRSGKFTQRDIDDMQAKLNRAKAAAGLPITYINGISHDELSKMSPELQGLVAEASLAGKSQFTESTSLDKTAKAVMDKAMENAWPEVGEIKASNKMALDFLKAQRDYADAEKRGDEGEMLDTLKGFWGKAVKEQYSETTRNLYANSLTDIGRLMEGITVNGREYKITKADLDQAVALDDRLLAAGLRDKPKFSNKNRAKYGYGEAPSSKVEGFGSSSTSSGSGKGSRGGSSVKVVNHYAHTVSNTSKSRLSVSGASASANRGKASVKLAGRRSAAPSGGAKVSIKKNKV